MSIVLKSVLCMGDDQIYARDKLFTPFPMEFLIPCGCLGSLRCPGVVPVSPGRASTAQVCLGLFVVCSFEGSLLRAPAAHFKLGLFF